MGWKKAESVHLTSSPSQTHDGRLEFSTHRPSPAAAHSALTQFLSTHTQGTRKPVPARALGPGGRRRAVRLHGCQAAASLREPSPSSTRPTTSPSFTTRKRSRLRRLRGRDHARRCPRR